MATSFFFLLFAKFCSYKDTQDLRTKVPWENFEITFLDVWNRLVLSNEVFRISPLHKGHPVAKVTDKKVLETFLSRE